jgi:hypothetical protein
VQATITGVSAIAAGYSHTVALKTDGTVWAWGDNSYGQLGNGININSNVPVQTSITGVAAIAAGLNHTVAVKTDGTVWAWGNNSYGQLGNGININSNIPVQTSITGVAAIAAGLNHTVAVKTDGTSWAWGNNSYGQLGDGTNIFSNVPVQTSITGVVAIAAGYSHTLALTTLLFYDVLPNHWAYQYILAMYNAGITTGYSDGTYRPTLNVSRSQMAAFIIRAIFGEDFSYSLAPHFSDVPSGHWAFKYVQKMYDEDITTGYSDGTYRPSQNVTRGQMASFIIKAMFPGGFSYTLTPYFSDVPSGHWAFQYVQKMYDEGITTGYADGTYRPSQYVNRAQMASFIARAFLGME